MRRHLITWCSRSVTVTTLVRTIGAPVGGISTGVCQNIVEQAAHPPWETLR